MVLTNKTKCVLLLIPYLYQEQTRFSAASFRLAPVNPETGMKNKSTSKIENTVGRKNNWWKNQLQLFHG